MRRLTIMLIPDQSNSTRQFSLPEWLVKATGVAAIGMSALLGYFTFDYIELSSMRTSFIKLSAENEGLKSEARVLLSNLEDVSKSLDRVQDYTAKLTEITDIKMKKVSKKTGIKSGIGPLSPEEYDLASANSAHNDSIPLGVNMEKLAFRPVFDRLFGVGLSARSNAIQLQNISLELKQAEIPSVFNSLD